MSPWNTRCPCRGALGPNLSQSSRNNLRCPEWFHGTGLAEAPWLRKSPPSPRGKSWLLLLGCSISEWHDLRIYHTGDWNILPRVCPKLSSPERSFVYLGVLLEAFWLVFSQCSYLSRLGYLEKAITLQKLQLCISCFKGHFFSSSNCPAINGHFHAVHSYSMTIL